MAANGPLLKILIRCRRFVPAACCALLMACAQPPLLHDTPTLLHDEFYPLAVVPADRDQVFAMSPSMRAYAATDLASVAQLRDARRALLDALYKNGKLQLNYDAAVTRNAAEAFDARAGNCLSLVIMTAAFARHFGVPVSFQSVRIDDTYARSGNLVLASGHVNLVLGRLTPRSMMSAPTVEPLTVDFLPADELRGQVVQPLAENTVLAMYFNNRAAEALADGRATEAYAWARESLRQAPAFLAALNTLGVLYLRDGHLVAAEAALQQVLSREPYSSSALSNLALLMQRDGRNAEADAMRARLLRVEREAPFESFEQGRLAMARGDYAKAREYFYRELRQQPYQSEVLFWTAQADWRMGDTARATRHLQQAMENSNSLGTRALYAGKLSWLRATQTQTR